MLRHSDYRSESVMTIIRTARWLFNVSGMQLVRVRPRYNLCRAGRATVLVQSRGGRGGGRPTQVSVFYTNPSPTIIPYLIRLTTVLCVYMPHVKYAVLSGLITFILCLHMNVSILMA